MDSQLKTQRESLKNYNQELKSANDSKDVAKASSIMDKMIELKKSINTNLFKIVEVQKQIIEKLNSSR